MIEPYSGRIYDPCCGSGGMFVQSEKFVEAHEGKLGDIAIYGQESNQTTWRLCKINLAIRGIDSNIQWGNSFTEDKQRDLKADYILANPPFNDKDWKAELLEDDVRWKYGIPPKRNANFAWVQHFIHHLSPTGIAGFVLSNGSMSGGGQEGKIREKIVKADLVDCMVALPSQLFYNTGIPAVYGFYAGTKTMITSVNEKMRYYLLMREKWAKWLTERTVSLIMKMCNKLHKYIIAGEEKVENIKMCLDFAKA